MPCRYPPLVLAFLAVLLSSPAATAQTDQNVPAAGKQAACASTK